MSTLLQDLETQIAGLKTTTIKSNVGIVREIGDGVAKIEGLSDVMLNEMIDFGTAFSASRSISRKPKSARSCSATTRNVMEGDEVQTTGKLLAVPVGKALLGRVVNTLGQPARWQGPDRARRPLIRSKRSRPASSSARASASRCRRASWRSTR